jgi:hypothetical protein
MKNMNLNEFPVKELETREQSVCNGGYAPKDELLDDKKLKDIINPKVIVLPVLW